MKRYLITPALMSIAVHSQAATADVGTALSTLAGHSGLTTVSMLAAGLIALGLARHRAK